MNFSFSFDKKINIIKKELQNYKKHFLLDSIACSLEDILLIYIKDFLCQNLREDTNFNNRTLNILRKLYNHSTPIYPIGYTDMRNEIVST